jgi:hypothetical protein
MLLMFDIVCVGGLRHNVIRPIVRCRLGARAGDSAVCDTG